MSAPKLLLLGLSLAPLALGGCVRNLCDEEPTDPHCVATMLPVSDAVTVTPPRVSLAVGGPLSIAVHPAAADGTQVVLRRLGASDLMLGVLQGGMLSTTLKPADLGAHGFTAGAASVVIVQSGQSGQPDLTATLRIFIEPQFTQPPLVYDTKPDTDYPTWVGIGKGGALYGLNLYPPFMGSTDRKQRLVDYQYVAGPLPAMDRLDKHMPVTFGGYKVDPFSTVAPARALLAGSQILVASFDNRNAQYPVIVDACQFATGQCNTLDPMTFSFTSVLGLATDPKASLLSVQTSGGTLAYRPSDMSPLAEKLAIDVLSMPAKFVATAVGDLDGDGQADVVVFGDSPASATVLMRQADGMQLHVNAARSAQLTSLLGGKAPTAATIADLDVDGLDDVVLVRDGLVVLLYSQADGNFIAGPQLPALIGIDSVAAGVIAQGARAGTPAKLDLAFASSTGQRLGVLLNQATF